MLTAMDPASKKRDLDSMLVGSSSPNIVSKRQKISHEESATVESATTAATEHLQVVEAQAGAAEMGMDLQAVVYVYSLEYEKMCNLMKIHELRVCKPSRRPFVALIKYLGFACARAR